MNLGKMKRALRIYNRRLAFRWAATGFAALAASVSWGLIRPGGTAAILVLAGAALAVITSLLLATLGRSVLWVELGETVRVRLLFSVRSLSWQEVSNLRLRRDSEAQPRLEVLAQGRTYSTHVSQGQVSAVLSLIRTFKPAAS